MIVQFLTKKYSRAIARVVLVSFIYQLLFPITTFALTSGPAQPEMQSFEPVGTTDMVDLFSGDFNYNVPLLDIEGYPINIAYHSGVGMEQEASWVGLGWNINPGAINHMVRGLSDDYNGEMLEKSIEINDEVVRKFQFGFGLEFAGVNGAEQAKKFLKYIKLNVGGSLNIGINISNYTGVSAELKMGADVSASRGYFSGGLNLGAAINTASGVDVDYSFSGGYKSQQNVSTAVNGSFGKGYNSREGLKYTSFGVNASVDFNHKVEKKNDGENDKKESKIQNAGTMSVPGLNASYVPISLQNFVPVITNSSYMKSTFYRFKLGFEFSSILPNFIGAIGQDRVSFGSDGTKRVYGYLNMQNASKDDIVDFSRDRDGRYNRMMEYLPPVNMSYDIFAVNGQGTGGNFRPFRNDIGTVYDPKISSHSKSGINMIEAGVGNIFEAGYDRTKSISTSSAAPWDAYYKRFSGKDKNNIREPYYFKQAGELSESNEDFKTSILGYSPLSTNHYSSSNIFSNQVSDIFNNPPANSGRTKRSNLLYFSTAKEASNSNHSLQPKLESYSNLGYPKDPVKLSRVNDYRKETQISEITQLLPDGRRYIYGIAAMNTAQHEYVVSCVAPGSGINNGVVSCSSSPTTIDPDFGQKFKMVSKTPPFAHSYLLSSVLSADYSDLTGDGITEDDLGNYTKFNYTMKDANYQWRTPYNNNEGQFDRGVQSDCHDDKATFIVGNKEIWMLHSIESRNFVAEFYTSSRSDALGSNDPLLASGHNRSYKLDRIELYSKKDRLNSNGTVNASATPIKTVQFTYDYSLCKGIPNKASGTGNIGKLTLKSISIKYGNSDIGYLSPYRFEYGGAVVGGVPSSINPNYDQTAKDRWGNYKPVSSNGQMGLSLTNYEYPFVNQTDPELDNNATAWNLTKVFLPSGGTINVSYESDDYAKVQDRSAMEMFKAAGIGMSKKFGTNNVLYNNLTLPNLYIYFKRRIGDELYPASYPNFMEKNYLNGSKVMQFNFDVQITPGTETESCPGTPLKDQIKGYANIEEVGVCEVDNTYGYVKLEAKNASSTAALKALKVGDIRINPITLTAINYARYYNNKSLYPSSDMVKANPAKIIMNLLETGTQVSDYLVNPLLRFFRDNKAKTFDPDRSYIRLNSQGFKNGGGHRVKKIEYSDQWSNIANDNAISNFDATYGSEYTYKTIDDNSGKEISSGVASYEPLQGGDENPFKAPMASDIVGKSRKFPVVDPIELTIEGPIGETMWPSASVGYSKVIVKSINKSKGESSQIVQEHEFYTANDFPVKTEHTDIHKIKDNPLKKVSLRAHRKEELRLSQGYTLYFNDMHGKPKMQKNSVDRLGNIELVSYKKYEYFSDNEKNLNNNVPCFVLPTSGPPNIVQKELGVEVDLSIDTREKEEKNATNGFMFNINVFMFGAFSVPLPSAFPKRPKSISKIFSSVVTTKVVQRYGILKSVETYDKGATVKLSNQVFDATTGQALITRVNTEHNDFQYDLKYPAYWAYKNMGPAYENIQYEETIQNNASIVNDTMYIYPTAANNYLANYRVGDELIVDIKKSCKTESDPKPESYKLWVVGKTNSKTANVVNSVKELCYPIIPYCSTAVGSPSDPLLYEGHKLCMNINTGELNTTNDQEHNQCMSVDEFKCMRGWQLRDNDLPTNYPIEHFSTKAEVPNCNLNVSVTDPNGGCLVPYEHRACDHGAMHIFPTSSSGTVISIANSANLVQWNSASSNNSSYVSPYDVNSNIFSTSHVLKIKYKLYATHEFYRINDPSVVLTTMHNNGVPFGTPGDYVCAENQVNIISDLTNYINQGKIVALPSTSLPHFDYQELTVCMPYDPNNLPGASTNIPNILANPNKSENYRYFLRYIEPTTCTPNKYALVAKFDIDRISATVLPRDQAYQTYNNKTALICLPHHRGAKSTSGTLMPFPSNDSIEVADVKIIRSGNRNQLQETVQQVASLENPVNGTTLKTSFQALASSATTYTDEAYIPEELADPNTAYFNPFVIGRQGNYKPLQEYVQHKGRNYTNNIDKNKGQFGYSSFWLSTSGASTYSNLEKFYKLIVPNTNSDNWYAKTKVEVYSPWGNDLEVRDASGNTHSNLFGYGNKLPVAVVSNSSWNNAISENFEDYGTKENEFIKDPSINFVLKYFQNPIKKWIINQIESFGPSLVSIVSNHHTGTKALSINSSIDIPLEIKETPLTPSVDATKVLTPFYLRRMQKYIVSLWKKQTSQNGNPSALAGISITYGASIHTLKVKTPVIDGWALYEGEFNIPISPVSYPNANLSFSVTTDPLIIDDIRIMPSISNMKAYVYHPITRRLVAVLDENHMATIFEYTPEGKLARIKKETEKGFLTLKESRESLRNITAMGGMIDLADPSTYIPVITDPYLVPNYNGLDIIISQ